ncbi:HU family DNA-binding protein [Hoylesella pleuritidis]|jgi:putative DNA-binding protein|uniref:Putative DNA-binding protein n=3 Tax=Hoylesella pleuritidis TaxID=407975 RepID=U2LBI9_9BACT|nr:HU family DNA-binding protein [Hoylesella pleuritidis]ERK01676.1 putative DNA-binding protein [Hoylesella pleuritidis F0068]
MAFWKRIKMKINGLWYPKSVLVGTPVTTKQVAERLARESTVSLADVYAVLLSLGSVLGDYMSQGRSVKLDGIGSFYFTATANKNGVAKEEDVSAKQINGVRVRFIPETSYKQNGSTPAGRRATRNLTDVSIEWEEWKGVKKKPKP